MYVIIGGCYDGYQSVIENSSYCYKDVNDTMVTWQESRTRCEEYNGDLVTFHNEEEIKYFSTENYENYWFGYRKQNKAVHEDNFSIPGNYIRPRIFSKSYIHKK